MYFSSTISSVLKRDLYNILWVSYCLKIKKNKLRSIYEQTVRLRFHYSKKTRKKMSMGLRTGKKLSEHRRMLWQ